MSLLQLASLLLKGLTALLGYLDKRQMLDAGAKTAFAEGLLKTAEMVADEKVIREWVARQPDSVVDSILSDRYTRGGDA